MDRLSLSSTLLRINNTICCSSYTFLNFYPLCYSSGNKMDHSRNNVKCCILKMRPRCLMIAFNLFRNSSTNVVRYISYIPENIPNLTFRINKIHGVPRAVGVRAKMVILLGQGIQSREGCLGRVVHPCGEVTEAPFLPDS